MPRPGLPALLGVVAVLSSSAAAGDSWVRVRSPHFEVLSDAGEAPAREAARRLERLRGVLLQLFPAREDVDRPITLLVLENRARFTSLVPRDSGRGAGLAGFFQGGTERDYAVLHLSPDQPRPFEAAEHEYAHLILNGSLPAQPVWVAEGLADVLSGAVHDGREARLGARRSEYEALLRVPVNEPLDPPLGVNVPATADVEQRLGDLLLHGGHPKTAHRHFERALAADPAHVPTRNSLGGLLVRQGEWDAAREHLQAALAVQPDDPVALLRDARPRLGKAREQGVALSPEDEAQIVAGLEAALSQAALKEAQSEGPAGARDLIGYEIVVEYEKSHTVIRFDDATVPDTADELLAYLQGRARPIPLK